MPSYVCQYCNHNFSLKTDLDRHLKKKNACIPIAQMQQLQVNEQQPDRSKNVQEISSIFKSCLDILRNDEGHLVGDEALPELSRMIIYKQMEKLIDDGTIVWENLKNYDEIKERWGESYERKISYAKFSNLFTYITDKTQPERIENLMEIMNEFLWKTIGSNHPKLRCVFPEDGKFTIKTPQTFKELMIVLSKVDFNKFDFDILGEAYERLFVDAIFGAGGNKKSEFGQYFTPRQVIQFMINEVELKINENGEIESFADFSCGTGGILITAINHYRKYIHQGLVTEEQLKEQFKRKLFGIEIKDKLFNLCAANILLHTGEVLENIILGDSIRKYRNFNVDKIVMNPPFSVKIDYDSLFIQKNDNNDLHLHMNDIMPIRVGGKNSESLFLQMMIHHLNIGGKCATVMLDGQKMDNNSSGNREVREYLMKSCNLKAVIYCQGGTFTSTASKTCILFFTKKKKRADVVNVIGSGNKRSYEFTSSHATKVVKFYDYRPEIEGGKFLLEEVPISKIASKNYSLRLQDYEEEDEQQEIDGVQWMKLGDICEFKNGKTLSRENMTEGIIPVIGGGKKPSGYHDDYNVLENTILCSSSGAYAGYINRYSTKVWASDCFSISSTNEDVLKNDYLFNFLKMKQDDIYKLQTGAGQPHVYSKNLANIQIPIPSLEMQQNFIDYCDNINTNNQQIEKTIKIIQQNNDNYLKMCKMRFTNGKQYVLKKLEDICDFKNGYAFDKDDFKDKFIGGIPVVKIQSICNESINIEKANTYVSEKNILKNYELHFNNILIALSGATLGKIGIYKESKKAYVNQRILRIIIENDDTRNFFLYWYLSHEIGDKILNYAIKKSPTQPNISPTYIANIMIPIPSPEEQKNILEFCELYQNKIKKNEELIEHLQNSIDESTHNATLYLELMVQNTFSTNNQEDIEEISNQLNEQKIEEETLPNIREEPVRPIKKASASSVTSQRIKKV